MSERGPTHRCRGAPPIGGASLNFGVGRRETYFVACIAPGVSLVVAANLEKYSRKNTLQY
jgi:hypothetical protein